MCIYFAMRDILLILYEQIKSMCTYEFEVNTMSYSELED